MPGPMESGRGKNQDRGVNEQREHERRARIDSCKLNSFAPAIWCLLEFPRLHNGRVQIQVVRHYGSPKDTDADVKHSLVCDHMCPRDKAKRHPYNAWLRKKQLQRETRSDSRD